MKRLIMILFALMCAIGTKGQVPYNFGVSISENDEKWNEYWTTRKGDSLISAIINNDTVNAIIYKTKDVEYVVFDSYVFNGKNYFIFSKSKIVEHSDRICKIDEYYTSQPDTEIQIQDYKTKRGFAHHYILTTNLKRNLTENEKVFFKEKYFTSMFEVE